MGCSHACVVVLEGSDEECIWPCGCSECVVRPGTVQHISRRRRAARGKKRGSLRRKWGFEAGTLYGHKSRGGIMRNKCTPPPRTTNLVHPARVYGGVALGSTAVVCTLRMAWRLPG
jgi:hypothetical protein